MKSSKNRLIVLLIHILATIGNRRDAVTPKAVGADTIKHVQTRSVNLNSTYWFQTTSSPSLCLTYNTYTECGDNGLWHIREKRVYKQSWGRGGGRREKRRGVNDGNHLEGRNNIQGRNTNVHNVIFEAEDLPEGQPEGQPSEQKEYEIRVYEEGRTPKDKMSRQRYGLGDKLLKALKLRAQGTPPPRRRPSSNDCLNLSPSTGMLQIIPCEQITTGWRDVYGKLYQGGRCIKDYQGVVVSDDEEDSGDDDDDDHEEEEEEEEECKRFSFIPYTAPVEERREKRERMDEGFAPQNVEGLSKQQRRSVLKSSNSILHTTNPTDHPHHTSLSSPSSSSTSNSASPPLHRSTTSNLDDLGVNVNIEMPITPYKGTNGVYKDEQTGLTYPTRLKLGGGEGISQQSKKAQTLVGVGIYTRTYFKIKIYGVAYYVDEDQVRMDAGMMTYKGYGVEEMQESDEFYDLMMNMGASGGTAGLEERIGFDRTIILNLNMQLDAETMRNSLEADWELLSEEQKEKMASSSFKPRPASSTAIESLRSGSTSCTCGQSVPIEFTSANPKCCARGTTLAFTWRRAGSLEIRLNNVLMDSFSDPSMAKAIYYEYFRADDPISPDFRLHAADGFPSVLAPLLQLGKREVDLGGKGGSSSSSSSGSSKKEEKSKARPKLNLPQFNPPSLPSPQALAHDLVHNTRNVIQGAWGAGKNVGREIEGLFEGIKRQAGKQIGRIGGRGGLVGGEEKIEIKDDTEEEREENTTTHTFQDLATHFYLLLLLMVSLPPVGAKEKKVVVVWRRKRTSHLSSNNGRLETILEEGNGGKGIKNQRRGLSQKSLSWCF